MEIKRLNMIAAGILAAVLTFSCSKGSGPHGNAGTDEGPVIPVPPEEVDMENVFLVDFMTTLTDESFLSRYETTAVEQQIKAQTGKKPLVNLIDRMDFEAGTPHPLVQLAKQLSAYPFFAQVAGTGRAMTPGTGILTIYPISDYDGAALEDETFISGCMLRAPLNPAADIIIYTARLEKEGQLDRIMEARRDRILKNGVLIGTIRKDLVPSLKDRFAKNTDFRLELRSGDGTAYDLFVIASVRFVCRDIAEGSSEDQVDHFRISIEKIA